MALKFDSFYYLTDTGFWVVMYTVTNFGTGHEIGT